MKRKQTTWQKIQKNSVYKKVTRTTKKGWNYLQRPSAAQSAITWAVLVGTLIGLGYCSDTQRKSQRGTSYHIEQPVKNFEPISLAYSSDLEIKVNRYR